MLNRSLNVRRSLSLRPVKRINYASSWQFCKNLERLSQPILLINTTNIFLTRRKLSSFENYQEETLDILHKIDKRIKGIRSAIQSSQQEAYSGQDASSLPISEVSSRCCQIYISLPSLLSRRSHFRTSILRAIVLDYGLDIQLISSITQCTDFQSMHSFEIHQLQKLRDACVPQYETIFAVLLSESKGDLGLKFLLNLRKDASDYIRLIKDSDEELRGKLIMLSKDLKRMLGIWFNSGILGEAFA